MNWPGATPNSFINSPVNPVYSHPSASHSPGGIPNLTHWSGGATVSDPSSNAAPGSGVMVPNSYNQLPGNSSSHPYHHNGGSLNHHPTPAVHPSSFSSSGSPMINSNLPLEASSAGVTPTTPNISNQNYLANQSSYSDPHSHHVPGSGHSNPQNHGASTPAGSQAGSPGSLVGGASDIVSNASTSVPNNSNSNGKRARSSVLKKSSAQEGSLKSSNLNNSSHNNLDKKKRMKQDHGPNSPIATPGKLSLNGLQSIPNSRTPSISTPPPTVPPGPTSNSRQSIDLADQPSPGVHLSSYSAQPSPAGGAIAELVPHPVLSSNVSGIPGALLEKRDPNSVVLSPKPPTAPQVSNTSHQPTPNQFAPRASTPVGSAPSASGNNLGLNSSHPSGSPFKGRAASTQFETAQSNGAVVQAYSKPINQPSRTEYVPLCKQTDHSGGWDLREADEIYNFRMTSKPRRTLDDLGLVDVHSLVMSLKSRIGSEVAYALNTLTVIGPHLKLFREENSGNLGILSMPLPMCEDLLEELLDLLDDVAFKSNVTCESDRQDQPLTDDPSSSGFCHMIAHAIDEAARLLPLDLSIEDSEDSDEDSDLRPPIGQVEIIFSILNILRSFGMTEESGQYIGRTARSVSLLTDLCELGNPKSKILRQSLRLTTLDKLRIKREALQILSDVGHGIDLEEQSDHTVLALLRIVLFFLSDSPHQIDRSPFEGEGNYGLKAGQEVNLTTQLRLRSLSIVPSHVDAAMSLMSKVGTLDGNRRRIEESLSNSKSGFVLEQLIETLTKLIPVTGEEMLLVVSEDETRMRAEILAMALFNLVNLNPSGTVTEMEDRWRRRSMLMRSLVRTIGRFLVLGDDQVSTIISMKAIAMQVLIERLVETIRVLIEQAESNPSSKGISKLSFRSYRTGKSLDEPIHWFGGGFEDDESVKEIGSSLIIQDEADDEDDRSSNGSKIRLLPKVSIDSHLRELRKGHVENSDESEQGTNRRASSDRRNSSKNSILTNHHPPPTTSQLLGGGKNGLTGGSIRWRSELIKMLGGIGMNINLSALNNNNPNNSHHHPNHPNHGPIGCLISPNLFDLFLKILD